MKNKIKMLLRFSFKMNIFLEEQKSYKKFKVLPCPTT